MKLVNILFCEAALSIHNCRQLCHAIHGVKVVFFCRSPDKQN